MDCASIYYGRKKNRRFSHLGGISRVSLDYDFTGNILARHESHQKAAGAPADVLLKTCTYDPRGRLLSDSTRLNGTGNWAVVHPNIATDMKSEIESMGWWMPHGVTGDVSIKMYASTYLNVDYYTYFPASRKLWNIESNRQPSLIRTNITTFNKFLFGNLVSKKK